eukprot:1257840-Pleurochrysis_carterae.AAC.2
MLAVRPVALVLALAHRIHERVRLRWVGQSWQRSPHVTARAQRIATRMGASTQHARSRACHQMCVCGPICVCACATA